MIDHTFEPNLVGAPSLSVPLGKIVWKVTVWVIGPYLDLCH